MMSGMGATTMGKAFTATQEEAAKQMRQAFLDAWAKSCDEFMHSEQFLDMMKSAMDGALAFRERMNQFISNTMQGGPIPSRDDTDSILQAVRTLEERVLDRLELLSQRVDALESDVGSTKRKPKAGAKQKRNET